MKNDKLIEKLNKNLADLQVLYVKLHNYHWNIKGQHFFGIHNVTEEYYNYFAEQYDEVAERILQIGGKPLTTMKSYLENSSIKEEDKKEFSASDVLNGVKSDFYYLKNEYTEISKLAEELRDLTTQGIADDNIAWLEKAIWMLDATL
ncbi:MAG: DNA starvation/stationary phase protection protein [Ignavibacteriales bacterium]|nr:DNA starvation/stationary phase protection protein [Ignavibacteriales bacterium]MCB9207778.1 DNA starvation/stationary phase protection protein [Ignavibacteriales bacterium]MCB9258548.1 DNA starvation/stationary phase protection protein [Ignavibacteriales bacterium]